MTHHPLRALDARLMRTVAVTTTEIETEGECAGRYVWRDAAGNKFMWGSDPVRHEFHWVETVAEADQLSLLCPGCFEKNGGAVGTHRVRVTFADRGVPDDVGSRGTNGPTRWHASGTSLDDLVLTPSILLGPHGCGWHGFVGSSGVPPGHVG